MNVALIGNDLLLSSKVEAAVRATGAGFAVGRLPFNPDGKLPKSDVVFIDLNFEESGIAAIAAVRRTQPDTKIVAFCGHEERERRKRAMAAGASLCVTNGAIVPAVRKLLADEEAGSAS
jgi:DNA-binding NarL/FixJ family response regulator